MHTDLQSLRVAIPYIRRYKSHSFVVKLSGGLCRPGAVLDHVVEQVALLHQLGIHVVLVHGGGEQADELARRLDLPIQRVAGRRVTDRGMLEVAKMSFAGAVNTDLVAACAKAGVPAIGISGVDAQVIIAARRPPVAVEEEGVRREVDYGLVGDVQEVRIAPLTALLRSGFVPVIASLAADTAGQVLNVNADTIAARLAAALGAAKLFLLTNVDGVFRDVRDPTTLCSLLDLAQLDELERSGAIAGGMLPKLAAVRQALRDGVPRVHVINGAEPDTLLAEVFTNEGRGTLLVRAQAEPEAPGQARVLPTAIDSPASGDQAWPA